MIKVIIFDCDGMIIKREMYFSQRFSRDFKVPLEKIMKFFNNEFRLCEIGKADLRQELKRYLKQWNWNKNIDELLECWFSSEREIDTKMLASIRSLRNKGMKCYISTNNEKYRTTDLMDNVGLSQIADGILSSCFLGHLKFQSEFWESAYKIIGPISKEEILVFDDKSDAVESAKAFGFQAELYIDFERYSRVLDRYQIVC